MILLVFFAPFFIVIICLVMHDNSNIEEVKKYFKNNSCEKIYYYKSNFKSICKNSLIIVKNQFTIDFKENTYISYENIEKTKKNKSNLDIMTKNKNIKIYFETKEEINEFQKSLEDKIK